MFAREQVAAEKKKKVFLNEDHQYRDFSQVITLFMLRLKTPSICNQEKHQRRISYRLVQKHLLPNLLSPSPVFGEFPEGTHRQKPLQFKFLGP